MSGEFRMTEVSEMEFYSNIVFIYYNFRCHILIHLV